mgnify:CR=1 FL=1
MVPLLMRLLLVPCPMKLIWPVRVVPASSVRLVPVPLVRRPEANVSKVTLLPTNVAEVAKVRAALEPSVAVGPVKLAPFCKVNELLFPKARLPCSVAPSNVPEGPYVSAPAEI